MSDKQKEVKDLWEQTRRDLDRDQRPKEGLLKVMGILEWYLNEPAKVREDAGLAKYLDTELVAGLIKRLNRERSQDLQYMEVISQLLKVMVKLLVANIGTENSDLIDSFRNLLDSDTILHNYNFQYNEEQMKRLHYVEEDWRKEIKEGDMVDLIKEEPKMKCSGWAQAKVKAVKGDVLMLQYLHELEDYDTTEDRFSTNIAKFESKTKNDWEWKATLKEGDVCDCFDKAIWIKSTILELKTDTKADGREVTYAWIGYRVYSNEGDKEDEKGKYSGYGNRYNEWVKIYTSRIAKIGTRSIKGSMEEDYDDMMDSQIVGEGGKPVYCVPRRRHCTSKVMIDCYNMFGDLGGFKKVMQVISDATKPIGLEILFYYMDIIAKMYPSLHRNFAEGYVPDLKKAVSSCILNAPAASLRDIRKERIDGIFRALENLMKRIQKREDREKDINVLKLDFSLLCIKSPYLERRIQGIKDVSSIIKDVRIYGSKSFSQEFLVEWARGHNVFEYVFSAKHCHIQLVQRSTDLMKLFIATNQLSKDEMDMFWNCSKFDDHIKLEVYKVLSDLSFNMKKEQLDYFLDAIAASSPEKLIPEEVKTLFEMGQFAQDFDFFTKICNLLWTLALGSEGYSDEIVNLSRAKYVEITRKLSAKAKLDIFVKLLEGLKENKETVQRIKIFVEMMKDKNDRQMYSNNTYQSGGDEEEKKEPTLTVQETLYVLQNEHGLIDAFYKNLGAYYDAVKAKVNAKEAEIPLSKQKLFGRYTHREEVQERLEFLKTIANNSIFKIEEADFDKLWATLGKASPDPEDEQLLFKWFKESCDINEVGAFFNQKMQNGQMNIATMSLEGYDCLQNFFLAKNEKEGNLARNKDQSTGEKRGHMTSYSNMQGPMYGNFNFLRIKRRLPSKDPISEEPSVRFKVYKEPKELIDLDLMWSIALQSETSEVQNKSVDFLIQVYHNLSNDLEKEKTSIQNQFIITCFDKLKSILEDKSVDNHVQQVMICRVIQILKQLIYESERNGTAGLRPHGALLRGELLEGLTVKNNQIKMYSNTTIWELKKELAKLSDLSAQYVRVIRNGEEIDDVNNGKTLYDLNFTHGENLVVQKKSADDIPEAPLLNSENQLTPEAERIFRDWFDQFSTDGEMQPQQCADFIKSCTGEPVRATDDRVVGLVKQYGGKILVDNFLDFYRTACRTKSGTVRENLKAHNVRNDLKKFSEISDEENLKKEDMPRYKISRNLDWQNLLFALLDRNDSTSVTTWDLINMLVTNPDIYQKTLSMDGVKDADDWARIFEQGSVYKRLYTLQIIESIMEDIGKKEDTTSESGTEEKWGSINWKHFAKIGQKYFLGQFMTLDIDVLNNDNSNISAMYSKKYLGFVSKFLRVFVMAAQKALEPAKYNLTLLRRSSTQEMTDDVNEDTERFNELSQIMQGGLAEDIISSIDFPKLQERTLLLVSFIAGKQEVSYEDFVVLQNSLPLWANAYVSASDPAALVKQFFDNITFAPADMVVKGVYYPGESQMARKMRSEFSTNIGIMTQQTRSLPNSPLSYYLDLLTTNMPKAGAKNCLEFYDLLSDLVNQSFDKESKVDFNPEKLLTNAISNMKDFQQNDDHQNLIGCFKVIKVITEVFPIQKVEALLKGIELLPFSQNIDAPEFAEIKTIEQDDTLINQARDAAQDLLNSLCQRSKKFFLDYLKNTLSPLLAKVKRREGWRYNPINESKTGRFVGLRNLGCICYMNSMLQQFYMVPVFRYSLLSVDDGAPEDMQPYKGKEVDDNMLHQLQRLMTHLELSERTDYNPSDFCFSFKDFDGQPTNTSIQQDAQEFLNVIFDRIESMLRPTPQKYLLQSVFGGKMCNQIICKECGRVTNRIEDFYNLSLAVKDRKHVYESLDKLIEGEVISDFNCEGCNKKVSIHKRSLISDCPNVLIVHLQRFAFNFDTFRNDKINTLFEFPQILDLAPYSFYDVMRKDGKQRPENPTDAEAWPEEDSCYEYKLVGVTIHTGTANAGHYYSYINTRRGGAEVDPSSQVWEQTHQDPWKEFNDSTVSEFNFERLENECFGGDGKESNDFGMSMMSSSTYGKSGYMLVYERRHKKPIKVLSDAPNAVFDEKKEEKYVMRDYNEMNKIVPNKIYKQVWEDNQYFIFEKNVYSLVEKINFVKEVQPAEGEDPALAAEVNRTIARTGMRFALAILAKSFNNGAIKDMAEVIRSIFEKQLDACQEFLEDILKDDCGLFLEVLLECPDSDFRKEIASIVSIALKRVYEVEKDNRKEEETRCEGEGEAQVCTMIPKALSCRVIYFFLGAFKELAPKNWLKLPEYLSVFKDFGDASSDHLRYLFEVKLVERGLDFILGRKSPLFKTGEKRPEMGGYSSQPNFGSLISLISSMQSNPLVQEYPLTELEQKMLFMPTYLKQIFNAGSGHENFGVSLAEMCKDNEKLSKKVCKMFVNGINNSDFEKIENYSEALKPLLLLNDQFKRKRLEWVFGYPEIYRWNRNEDVFKVGVDVLYRVSEDCYNYKSPLVQAPEDPLFCHMWKCRNKMEIFTCKLLKDVVELMAQDDEIARFFTNSAPPTYCQARYSDWIKEFLDAQLDEILKSNLGSYYEQKEKKVRAALELWKTYEEKIKKFEEENKASKQDFVLSEADLEKGAIQHYPNPIIHLKSYSQNLIEKQTVDEIEITVHEVVCDWVYGKPTGSTNFAVPVDVFQKGLPPPPRKIEKPVEASAAPAVDPQSAPEVSGGYPTEEEREQVENIKRGPVLIAFRVFNKRKGMIKAYISFNGTQEEMNLSCPASELKSQVFAGNQQDMFVATKIFPERPWGKISYNFRYKDLSVGDTADNEEDVVTPKNNYRNQNVTINVMHIDRGAAGTTNCPNCNKPNEVNQPTCEACGEELVGQYDYYA